MITTFEKWLEDKCDYTGVLDDDYEDTLDRWMSELDVQELIDYGQEYADEKCSQDVEIAVKTIQSFTQDTITKEIQTWAVESIGWKALQSLSLALEVK
jgi:hypothetical protein